MEIIVTNTSTTASMPPSKQVLTDEETRAILTPFAFKIDESLFGVSLAKPWKRAAALLIDLAIIALLSDAPGELLAIVVAITLYRLGNKKESQKTSKSKGRKRRAILRGIGIFMIFLILLNTLPELFNTLTDKTQQKQSKHNANDIDEFNLDAVFANNPQAVLLFSKVLINVGMSDCESLSCWEKTLKNVPDLLLSLPEKTLSNAKLNNIVNKIVDKTALTKIERQQLSQHLIQQYNEKRSSQIVDKKIKSSQDQPTKNNANIDTLLTKNNKTVLKSQQKVNPVETSKPVYSIVELFKGIIDDLGLGFGWAAFYFTILTALWHGQTLGKKALRIKVLQLDGTPLTLFDSFERYGGYGAGIATGMLGFIQIFWDPNRQAIHDKISSTVVIDIAKPPEGAGFS